MWNVVVMTAFVIAASLRGHVSAQMMDMSPSSGPSGSPDCMTNLLNMTDCLSYVQVGDGGGAAKPDKPCCPELAGLVESSPQCLCYLLAGDVGAQYGIKIDKAKALKLPGICGVLTPDPSLCSLIGVSVGVPVGSPAVAPSPISGAESPGGIATGPSSSRQSNAPRNVHFTLLVLPLAFALQIYF